MSSMLKYGSIEANPQCKRKQNYFLKPNTDKSVSKNQSAEKETNVKNSNNSNVLANSFK